MAEEEHSSKRIGISNSDSSGSFIPGLNDDVAQNCLALVSRLNYPSLACVNKKFKELINGGDLLAQRKNLEYLVFMLRHPKGCVMFSPMQNKWPMLPKIPNEAWIKTSLVIHDELWVFGAELFKFTIWKFSLRSGCWVKCEDMHCPRRSFASGSLGGIAIVAGGQNMYVKELASAELYDSSTGRWEMLPNMHTPRNGGSGFFMDGKFYVIGGGLNCGEEFDLETRKWRKIEGMCPYVNRAVVDQSSFAVVNDELFTLYESYIMKKYNKANNKWETIGRLPPPMGDSSNGWEREIKACGDQLFVFCKEEVSGGNERFVVNSWCPKSGVKDENLDLKLVGFKDNFGGCVYDFTVMRC